jgi:hypothetical protein
MYPQARKQPRKGPVVELKPGTRLRSAVGPAEVVVIRAPAGDVAVTIGGVPVVGLDEEPAAAAIEPGGEGATLLGKRYVNGDQTLELLCSKPGDGALAVNGVALELKEAKPLPSSD